MIDLLSICRELRVVFPKPSKLEKVADHFSKYGLGAVEVQDAFRSLTNFWKKDGWVLSETYAIQLEDDEDALFHERGITVIKTPDDLPSDKALLKLIPMGQVDNKVVWF